MNWLLWIVWALKIALHLIGNMNRFRKEVPEAWQSIGAARQEILTSLSGGLSPDEVAQIREKFEKVWGEADDVFRLISEVVPLGFQRPDKVD